MRPVVQHRMSYGSVLGLAFGLLLGPPGGVGAEGSNPAVDRATAQLMLRDSPEGLSLQPRPRFAYLLGNTNSVRWITSESAAGLAFEATPEAPSVLIEVLPVGKECVPPRDACPVPFPLGPIGPLPLPPIPPPSSQLELRSDARASHDDLSIQSMEDGTITLAATGQTPFLIVADRRIHPLLPSAKMNFKPPLEIYRLQAVGRFAPGFESAKEATDFALLPCPGQSLERGLCTSERAAALLRRPR